MSATETAPTTTAQDPQPPTAVVEGEEQTPQEKLASLQTQYDEIKELAAEDPDDEDVKELMDEAAREITAVVAQINSADLALGFRQGALCELHWDAREWLPGRVVEVVQPDKLTRVQFKVELLGYKHVEMVYADKLRKWRPPEVELKSGVECHGIHTDEAWHPCIIDRVTPNSTVWVDFTEKTLQPPRLELRLTHIKFGKHMNTLRRKVELSEEELKEKRERRKQKKKEHSKMKTANREDLLIQNALDWAQFRGDGPAGADDEEEPAPPSKKQRRW